MIIDLILDRKDGDDYNARDFYFNVLEYGEPGRAITQALDGGTNEDIQNALVDYILEYEYKPGICDYIFSVDWL